MTELNCKGYTAIINADPDTGLFHGQVTNIRALLTIGGCSMNEVKAAFEEAVADYEVWCRERDEVRGRKSGPCLIPETGFDEWRAINAPWPNKGYAHK